MRASLDPLGVPLAGTQLVEASAGTGKTHAITTLFVRLLLERGVTADQILVVTYTNAATAELRDRIRRRLVAALAGCGRPERLPDAEGDLRDLLRRREPRAAEDRRALELALRSFDETAISTVHAFCQRVLRENAFECGASFDAELLGDESRLRDEILRDFWIRELSDADRSFVTGVRDRSQLGIGLLGGLVRKTLSNPDLRVFPEDVAPAPDADARRAWQVVREAVLAAWNRREIECLLVGDPGLSHAAGNYHADTVPKLLDGLEAALAAETPAVSLRLERLEMLTPGGLAKRTVRKSTAPAHPFFDACERLLEVEAPWRRHVDELPLRLVSWARREAAARKQRLDRLSFDDLLLRLRDALRGDDGEGLAAAIRTRHPVALIDEFQDTDPVQWEIFDRVWGRRHGPLFLIGDPKQAIYGFRGADVFAYLAARSRASEEWSLDVNRRSDPGLLRALNAFFGRSAAPFELPEIEYFDVAAPPGRQDGIRAAPGTPGPAPDLAAPFRVLLLPDELRGKNGITATTAKEVIPPRVADEIVRLLEAGLEIPGRHGAPAHRVRPGDVAVLCRTNREAGQVQEALQARGVPAVLQGDRSVFESDEAAEITTLLEAVAEPTDPRLLRAAMATTLYGATASDIAAFAGDDRLFDEATTRFFHWNTVWKEEGFLRAFRAVLDELAVPVRLLRHPRGERRLTNVLHVAELLHRAAVTGHRGPHELIDWLRREREEGAVSGGLAAEEMQIRLESDAAAVTLTTIHKAKGLEWPIVFCPYLWTVSKLRFDDEVYLRFHDDEKRLCLDVGSPDVDRHREIAEREGRAEDLRLLYVALTRARHQCSIVWGGIRGAGGSPLARFLAPGGEVSAHEEGVRAAMGPFLAEAGDSVAVRTLGAPRPERWRDDGPPAPELVAPVFGRGAPLDASWRTSSFTALAASPNVAVSREAHEGIDRDEIAAPAPEAAAGGESELPLADFPAGARAGILVHEILERIDFARTDREAFERTIESRLRLAGFDGRWRDPLRTAIDGLLDTTITTPRASFRLADVPRRGRLAEMGFTLPVGPDDGRRRLTRDALAAVFARHAAGPVAAYAARLRGLGFSALAGYLRGSMDLVFEHADRFWLVDWKSNHLGRRAADYRPDRLSTAMGAHHYVLQYHLYVATLDRYLRLRKPGYSYERDFGGVLYLFVRGFPPGGDGTTGVFFDRPSAVLVEDLGALLETARAEAQP